MARIYEYQGKEVLRKIGIPVPRGSSIVSPDEAKKVAQEVGKPVALKAQVWATGRFKAGGIKFAESPEEAEKIAQELIGSTIKGLSVEKVLVEEKLDIEREFYAGVIVNDSYKVKGPVLIFSTEGGVDIEEVASRSPEKVASMNVDYLKGVEPAEVKELVLKPAFDGTIPPELSDKLSEIICKLYRAFKEYDARIAEINPLVLTKDKHIYAADCRFTIDDNSVFRHPEFGIKVPRDMEREATELEEIAWAIEEGDFRGTGYFTQMVSKIEGEGWIGFHGIGGGGAMLAASALVARGFKIADYADTSGDPTASKVYRVIKCILSQPIDAYVLMGSCIANQEQWHHAHGIVKALKEESEKRPGFPVLLLIAGNKERETHEIIKDGLKGVPLRWELYGRDYIYATDFIAGRVKELMEAYKKDKGDKYHAPIRKRRVADTNNRLEFNAKTAKITIDYSRCEPALRNISNPSCRFACVNACRLYGRNILKIEGNKPVLAVTDPAEIERLDNECISCEFNCWLRGTDCITIDLPLSGLEEYREKIEKGGK